MIPVAAIHSPTYIAVAIRDGAVVARLEDCSARYAIAAIRDTRAARRPGTELHLRVGDLDYAILRDVSESN